MEVQRRPTRKNRKYTVALETDLRSYILELFILRRSLDMTWSVKRTRAVDVETNIEITWMK